jgi:hypothetical protein
MTRKLVDYEFEKGYGEDVLTYSRYYPVVYLRVLYQTIKKNMTQDKHTQIQI